MTINDLRPPALKRRRYQFRLRTLLLLGLFVVSGCGQSEEDRQQRAIDAYSRGLDHAGEGQYDKAIADYTEAIRLGLPKVPQIYNYHGKTLMSVSPSMLDAYLRRAEACCEKGELDESIADYTEAIRLDPNDPFGAYSYRADIYEKKGQLDEAIADRSEAIRLAPKDPVTCYQRGRTYLQKDEIDQAITDFDEVIRLDPTYAPAYFNRGLAYEEEGDRAKAEADFDKAKELGYEPE